MHAIWEQILKCNVPMAYKIITLSETVRMICIIMYIIMYEIFINNIPSAGIKFLGWFWIVLKFYFLLLNNFNCYELPDFITYSLPFRLR